MKTGNRRTYVGGKLKVSEAREMLDGLVDGGGGGGCVFRGGGSPRGQPPCPIWTSARSAILGLEAGRRVMCCH